ncbi:MAG: TIGR02466 family protein [Gammaproteobacteria bacterium]|nr:TIGR02466 family protein [Gammaproteobacteria bacterium]
MSTSVDLFFGVPILVQDVEPAIRDSIEAKVAAYLASDEAKRDVEPAPEESVATSYYKPQRSVVADAGLDELADAVRAAAQTFLEKTLGLASRRLEIERAWINVFEPGAQEAQHTHDGSLLSCSYYVEAPENCGCIEFPDPIGERRGYREFTQTAGKNLMTRREIAIAPQPGRLVMFESWLAHSVQCNKSNARRVSIALNLRYSPAPAVPAAGGGAAAGAALGGDAADATAAAPSAPAGTAVPRPFLFNDVFDVHSNLHLNLTPIQDAIPTVVIDDVLKQPERARDIVGSMPAANWKHEAGGRNFVDYYDCRLRIPIRFPTALISVAQKAIQNVYQINTRPADASVDVNWFMQIEKKRADFAVPHCDITEKVQRSFTCILYLNRREECSGGTGFFRFKQSNSLAIDEAYARAVKADASISETGRDYWPAAADRVWEQVGSVDMVPGRMLIFPSEFFHAAYHPKDSFFDFPRLTLAFWMVT